MFCEFIEKQDEIIVIIVIKSFQILTENNLNGNKKSKKRKRDNKTEIIDEIAYSSPDDSSMIEDDIDKDPDWKKTPLYNRIQKLQVILCYGSYFNLNNKYYINVANIFYFYTKFLLSNRQVQKNYIIYNCIIRYNCEIIGIF